MCIKDRQLEFWGSECFDFCFCLILCAGCGFFVNMLCFKMFQDLVCPVDEGRWHACHSRHVDTEAMCASAWRKFAQEDDLVADLFIGDMIIPYTPEFFFQFVQFMIVRCKQCFRLLWCIMQMFCNTPCDGDTVVCRGTAADLVQQDEAARRNVVDDACSLIHLQHKVCFASAEIIRCTHTCKDLICK